jgi:hypothetical protein
LVSTATLLSPGFVSTPNLLNLVSTANLSQLVSTSQLDSRLLALTSNLGSFGYISSLQLVSTTAGLERYISSFIDPQELASSILPFISVPNLLNLVSTSYLTTQLNSTVAGLGTVGYQSTFRSTFLTLSTGLITTSTLTFFDALNANTANVVYVRSTFLYFNNYIVGGSTQLQPQIFTF